MGTLVLSIKVIALQPELNKEIIYLSARKGFPYYHGDFMKHFKKYFLSLSSSTSVPVAEKISVDSAHYIVTPPRKDVALLAFGLFQCTAIAIIKNNLHILMHIAHSNLYLPMETTGNSRILKGVFDGGTLINEVLSLLRSPKETRGNYKTKVFIMSGIYKECNICIESIYKGQKPIKKIIDMIGSDNVRLYKGSHIEIHSSGHVYGRLVNGEKISRLN